jgi:hypothetical protein
MEAMVQTGSYKGETGMPRLLALMKGDNRDHSFDSRYVCLLIAAGSSVDTEESPNPEAFEPERTAVTHSPLSEQIRI